MSIILATAQSQVMPWQGVIAATALSGLLAAAIGVFKRGSIRGPERLEPDESPNTLFLIVSLGLFAFFAAQLLLYSLVVSPKSTASTTSTTAPVELNDRQIIQLDLGARVVAIVVLLAATVFIRPRGIKRVGLDAGRIFPGLFKAVIGMLIIFPVLFWVMVLADLLLQLFHQNTHYVHPMLKMLGEENGDITLKRLIILTATVFAPISEELVFRGYLQTMLRAWTNRPWLVVVLTALLFASIHNSREAFPALFVLAVGLGYAYERTGNLWVSIFMHVIFNTTSVYMFTHGIQ